MKGKRFTDEKIAYALRQAEAGTPVADVLSASPKPDYYQHQPRTER
jgi:hypothetical protein